jgi:hypothetical protein
MNAHAQVEQREAARHRDCQIKCDVIDRKTDHIKTDMESLVRYIKSLLQDGPLDETALKCVSDAKLALLDASGALLAIGLAESAYKTRFSNRVTKGQTQ